MTSPQTRTPRLYGRILRTDRLSPETVDALYALFCRYYEAVSREKFLSDMGEKSHIIVMWDQATHEVKGLCTLLVWAETIQGRRCRIVYTGDTVVDQAYWGQRELQRLFTQFLLRVRLRYPFEGVYWFLISKGYRTYLQLTNNFFDFYPRYDRPTPPREAELLDRLARRKFPDEYVPAKGLVIYREQGGQVREGIAEITPDMLRNPHIRFFAERNPGYHLGHELVCVGELTFRVIAWSLLKVVLTRLGLRRRSAPEHQQTPARQPGEVSVG